MKAMTVQEFFARFPDDNACLDFLMHKHYGESLDCPKCGRHGKFHRIKRNPSYMCAWCSYEIYPMKGTIFSGSHTPLHKWFYAMYLFTTTRHGVPALELQRQLGVSYPTALRMAHIIREHMTDTDGENPLDRDVEADETYIGGKHPGRTGRGAIGKTIVFGMVERGGEVMTKVVPNVKKQTLLQHVHENVEKGSTVHTDELRSYNGLCKIGYRHERVNHSIGQYVDKGSHVNSIEGFWSRLKLSIRGTHIHVSGKHLHKYLKEFEFCYNHRKTPGRMFQALLDAL